MFARRIVACIVVGLCVLAVSSVSAVSTWNRTTHFTFSGPVRLPGVVLPPGTYTFELVTPNDLTLVRVLTRDRSRVYLTAFTHLVTRPAVGRLDPVITLGEAATAAPPPINVWYPQGERTGRQFIY